MLYESLSHKVLGAVFTVHNLIGPGLLESAYEGALVVELEHLGIPCFPAGGLSSPLSGAGGRGLHRRHGCRRQNYLGTQECIQAQSQHGSPNYQLLEALQGPGWVSYQLQKCQGSLAAV